MQKRSFKMSVAAACCGVSLLVGGAVAYAVSGTPEIDRANATINVQGNLTQVSCVGEDGIPYLTLSGSWVGGETQLVPDPTDYGLTGPVTISAIKWTTNMATKRGVLTATITLKTGSPLSTVYAGRLTLVTQGVPAAGAFVPARGWINAPIVRPDETAATTPDDNLIANVEFKLSPVTATGYFGTLPAQFGFPALSTVTNVAPVAADGTC